VEAAAAVARARARSISAALRNCYYLGSFNLLAALLRFRSKYFLVCRRLGLCKPRSCLTLLSMLS
jgi:hypothetical protein